MEPKPVVSIRFGRDWGLLIHFEGICRCGPMTGSRALDSGRCPALRSPMIARAVCSHVALGNLGITRLLSGSDCEQQLLLRRAVPLQRARLVHCGMWPAEQPTGTGWDDNSSRCSPDRSKACGLAKSCCGEIRPIVCICGGSPAWVVKLLAPLLWNFSNSF
ncbi:hypothetical protein BDV95DRAFT_564179 [Massariosphaeria phaeospora]|uniref:Uncharacterized protein n=1 Tax=Massariosphaeria phaeospora TaxID=100035 RepID=A0A7C8IAX2_9PLEO|nr:hypothetical protein BDV95DRAFT_564179 [Massariosphaeria phaeospora]